MSSRQPYPHNPYTQSVPPRDLPPNDLHPRRYQQPTFRAPRNQWDKFSAPRYEGEAYDIITPRKDKRKPPHQDLGKGDYVEDSRMVWGTSARLVRPGEPDRYGPSTPPKHYQIPRNPPVLDPRRRDLPPPEIERYTRAPGMVHSPHAKTFHPNPPLAQPSRPSTCNPKSMPRSKSPSTVAQRDSQNMTEDSHLRPELVIPPTQTPSSFDTPKEDSASLLDKVNTDSHDEESVGPTSTESENMAQQTMLPPPLARVETSSSLYQDAALTDMVVSLPSMVYNSSEWSLSSVLNKNSTPSEPLVEQGVKPEPVVVANEGSSTPEQPTSILPEDKGTTETLDFPMPPSEPVTPSTSVIVEVGSVEEQEESEIEDHSNAKPQETANQDLLPDATVNEPSEEAAIHPASEITNDNPAVETQVPISSNPPCPVGEPSVQHQSSTSASIIPKNVFLARLAPLPPYFSSGDIREMLLASERTCAYVDRMLQVNCFDTGLRRWLFSMKSGLDPLDEYQRQVAHRNTVLRTSAAKDIVKVTKIFGRKSAEVVREAEGNRSNKHQGTGFFGLRKRRSSTQRVSSPQDDNTIPATPRLSHEVTTNTSTTRSSPTTTPPFEHKSRNPSLTLFNSTISGSAASDPKSRLSGFFSSSPTEAGHEQKKRLSSFFSKKHNSAPSPPLPSETIPSHRWGRTFDSEYDWSDPKKSSESYPEGWQETVERMKGALPHVENGKIIEALKEANGDETRAIGIAILSGRDE